MPGWLNTNLKRPPGPRWPESKTPVYDVTVCVRWLTFDHRTVCPGSTSSWDGPYAENCTATSCTFGFEALPAGATTTSASKTTATTTLMPTPGRCRSSRASCDP